MLSQQTIGYRYCWETKIERDRVGRLRGETESDLAVKPANASSSEVPDRAGLTLARGATDGDSRDAMTAVHSAQQTIVERRP